MRQVVLNVPENKFPAFMKIIDSLDYVKKVEVERELTKAEILAGIREGFEEAKLIKAGKLKGIPINELLDEL